MFSLCSSAAHGMQTQWSGGVGNALYRANGGVSSHCEQHLRMEPCAAASSDVGGSGAPPTGLGESVEVSWMNSMDCSGGTAASDQMTVRGGGQRAASHGLRQFATHAPEFECTVLTQATWLAGGESVSDLSLLPPSLHWSVDAFTSFYLSRHSGRVLKFALEEVRPSPSYFFPRIEGLCARSRSLHPVVPRGCLCNLW